LCVAGVGLWDGKGRFDIFGTLRSHGLTRVFEGFARLLQAFHQTQTLEHNSSIGRLECYQERLVLLWKLLKEIDFSPDVNKLIVPLATCTAQIGLLHICTFVLLEIWGERSFGVALNKPFSETKHAYHTSQTHLQGSPIYSCFLTIVCNNSPYWRKKRPFPAIKMVNLFDVLSSPKFLFSGEQACKHLALLLEISNNMNSSRATNNSSIPLFNEMTPPTERLFKQKSTTVSNDAFLSSSIHYL